VRLRTSKATAGVVGVMVLPLALAACGSSSKGATTNTTPSGGASSSGGVKQTGGTVTIGFQGPLSGPNSPQLGINGVNGVKLAIDQANKAKELPYTLKLDQSDDQGTPDQGPTAARKLVDDKVIAVVGPMFSGATKASEPVFSQAGILSVSPSATNTALTTLGFKTFVRVVAPDSVQGKAAADYLVKKLKAKKVYSLDDNSDYGTGLSKALDAQLQADGATVTHDGINPTKNYTAEATKIIGSNPDAVYYSGYYSEFGPLTKALKAAGYKGVLMSGDGSNDDQYIKDAGGASNANGTYLTCACGDANSDPKAASFVSDYKALNGQPPGTYSGEAYDATNALIKVLKGLGDKPTASQVVDAYKKVDYEGLTKTVKFTSSGEVEGDAVYMYQVKDGKRVVLGLIPDLIK
jgi:branched-chain amino acid transport system substrate-binding protein